MSSPIPDPFQALRLTQTLYYITISIILVRLKRCLLHILYDTEFNASLMKLLAYDILLGILEDIQISSFKLLDAVYILSRYAYPFLALA